MLGSVDTLEELRPLFGDHQMDDVPKMRNALKRVVASTTTGLDTRDLFAPVIKCLPSNDLVVLKLACLYLRHYHDQEQVVILSICSLQRMCIDSNPTIRGLALKTMTAIKIPTIVEFALQAILNGLRDQSAYVRRIAAVSCVRLHFLSPADVTTNGIIDKLYRMIRDPDPIVVTNCLNSLEEILHEEGGVVINRNIAHYLLNKMGMFTEWSLVTVLTTLKRYRPKTEEETLDIMNIVDPLLKSNNSAVVIAALRYFLHLVQDMPHLQGEVFRRAKGQILQFLGGGNPELTYTLLEFIDSELETNKDTFQPHHNTFFCKYSEPTYVKMQKIKMLPTLTTEGNFNEILEELGMYCIDINSDVARTAVAAISVISTRKSEFFDTGVNKLLDLLQMKLDYVTSDILKALQQLDLKKCRSTQDAMNKIHSSSDLILNDDGKAAMVWLYGEYGEYLEQSPYVLEELLETTEESGQNEVKLSLLTATVKLFFKRPGECQEILGCVLEKCAQSENHDVRDRTLYYYKLLHSDVNLARNIICG